MYTALWLNNGYIFQHVFSPIKWIMDLLRLYCISFNFILINPLHFLGVLEEARFFGIESLVEELEKIVQVCIYLLYIQFIEILLIPKILGYIAFVIQLVFSLSIQSLVYAFNGSKSYQMFVCLFFSRKNMNVLLKMLLLQEEM